MPPTTRADDYPPVATGPETYQRGTAVPPTLTLDLGNRRLFAVEIATDPALFVDASARTPQTFFASWAAEQRLSRADAQNTTFTIPLAAWLQLRAADALYFRVLTSTTATQWVDALSSPTRPAPSIALNGQFTHALEQPYRDEELLWRRDPGA
jgi:hypothetical protein